MKKSLSLRKHLVQQDKLEKFKFCVKEDIEAMRPYFI